MGTSTLKSKDVEMETYSAALGLDASGEEVSGTPRVLSLLSSVLENSIRKNEKFSEVSKKKEVLTVFHGTRAPSLSIREYVERIFKYSRCSPSCFVVAYIYMDKFLRKMDCYLTSLNAHRLLITSVMVAAKFLDQLSFNNAYYAQVGGVSTAEMNNLELKFLFTLDFRLHVTLETFRSYCLQLEKEDGRMNHIKRQILVYGPKEAGEPTIAGYSGRAM